MKNLKFLLPLFAIILGIGVVFTTSAFKNKVNKPTKAFTYWQFTGDDINEVRDYTKYTQITNPEAPSCEEGSDIPCVLATPVAVNTPALLDAHLQNVSNYANDQAVLSAAMYKREAPSKK
ncbi:MAG: hypothetical protein EOO03_07210 [Chitinophagaceae bacterium]|nr:MAG: hypothetical protein EOO03_07210 [Chitinophagaceae bacterium]